VGHLVAAGSCLLRTGLPDPSEQQAGAEQYDSWSEEQCADIEIVDGMVVVSPSASKRRNRLARLLAPFSITVDLGDT
jgi:hypothetical protein